MALDKFSILFAVVLFLGAEISLISADQDGYNDDDDDNDDEAQWPAGVSPLDSLSFWDEADDVDSDDGINGCCLPKTWTGRLFVEVRREGGGGPRADKPKPPTSRTLRFVEKVYVDENNKRIAQDVTVPGRRRNATTISYILLFQNSSATLYTFSKTAKKCATKTLKDAQFRPQCLPDNATLLGSFSLGAGSNVLRSQSWGYLYRDRRVAIAANLILSPANCVPIIGGEKVFTRPRMSLDNDVNKKKVQVTTIGALYTDVTTQISDPSVFTPPSYCKKSEDALTFDPNVDVTTIIERFVAVP